jgi:hypothetical protein
MTSQAQEVLQAALALPTPGRAGLAEVHLASLDDIADGGTEEIEDAWRGEFEARACRFLDGRSDGPRHATGVRTGLGGTKVGRCTGGCRAARRAALVWSPAPVSSRHGWLRTP